MLKRILGVVMVSTLFVGGLTAAQAEEPGFTPNPHPHNVVIDWTEAMLLAIELNPPAPTATTWRMYVVMSSIYDAWAAYDGMAAGTETGYDLKRPGHESTDDKKAAALSQAAYRALSYTYPNQEPMFADVLDQLGYAPSDSTDVTTPEGIGNVAADAVIAARSADGSNAANGFAQITSDTYPELYKPYNSADPDADTGIFGENFDPNYWQPLRVPNGTVVDDDGNPVADPDVPTSYADQVFLTPHWGAVTPFALTSGDQFRAPAPPKYGSDAPYTDALGNVSTNTEAWIAQMDEVVEYSANLTDEHKIIAEFWADGPHTWTPPGHWVQIAIGLSLRDGHTIDQDVEMYMALTGALLDAGITAWDSKRAYDFIRPASAIRWYHAGDEIAAWGGPNQGTQLIDGSEWQPYQSSVFVTPPFAEYTSGHSTFSRAAREVLRSYTRSDAMYDGVTLLGRDYDGDGVEDLLGQHVAVNGSMLFEDGPAETVVLQWDTLLEAADEAGISRRYGGIHFQDGDMNARYAGKAVGLQAFEHASLLWNPFGESRSTVVGLAGAGDVTPAGSRDITRAITVASRTFSSGTAAGCAALGDVDTTIAQAVNRGNATADAAEIIRADLSVLTGSLCG